MPERYYLATLTGTELETIVAALKQADICGPRTDINNLLVYLNDVKEETDYNLKEEQYERHT